MLTTTVESEYVNTAADDLDDMLDYTVASSGDEAEAVLIEPEEDVKTDKKDKKKRKLTDDKLHNKKKLKMDYDCDQKKQLSLADPETILEKLATKIAQQNKDLSPLELGELYISKSFIKSSSNFTETRTLDNLSKFLQENFKHLIKVTVEKPKKKKKTPKRQDKVATQLAKAQLLEQKQSEQNNVKKFVAIISMSAIRACDTFRATKELGSIKLIKKNKLKDDLEILQKSNNRILNTTPSRILKIMNETNSPINEENIGVIILDNSYLDLKKQNILDVEETMLLLRRITDNNPEVVIYLY